MSLKPLKDNVLVRLIEEETKTKAGIVIPDKAKAMPTKAEIIAIGDDVKHVAEGQKVYINKFKPKRIRDEKFILKETDILAIYEQ